MLSDQFLDDLAKDLRPVRRPSMARDAALLAVLCLVELAGFILMGFLRPDMPDAVKEPSFWWKLLSLAVIAGFGSIVALGAANPAASPRKGVERLAMIVAVCLALGWLVDAMQPGMPMLLARLDVPSGVQCVYQIVLLSIPPVVALGYFLRRGAPTDPGRTSLAAGLAAAACGALVFVFSCPTDDPLYVAVWYSAGCGIVTLAARLVLPPLTRW